MRTHLLFVQGPKRGCGPDTPLFCLPVVLEGGNLSVGDLDTRRHKDRRPSAALKTKMSSEVIVVYRHIHSAYSLLIYIAYTCNRSEYAGSAHAGGPRPHTTSGPIQHTPGPFAAAPIETVPLRNSILTPTSGGLGDAATTAAPTTAAAVAVPAAIA